MLTAGALECLRGYAHRSRGASPVALTAAELKLARDPEKVLRRYADSTLLLGARLRGLRAGAAQLDWSASSNGRKGAGVVLESDTGEPEPSPRKVRLRQPHA